MFIEDGATRDYVYCRYGIVIAIFIFTAIIIVVFNFITFVIISSSGGDAFPESKVNIVIDVILTVVLLLSSCCFQVIL